MLILFLDESGDHNLDKIDEQYPIFVLGGCVFEYDYYKDYASIEFQDYKENMFGTKKLIVHTADICRTRNGFERLKDNAFRQKFYDKTNAIMRGLDFIALACVIKKDKHFSKHGLQAKDPYLLSLDLVIERFVFMLKEKNTYGVIVAESRNDILDKQLELAFLSLKVKGTNFVSAKDINTRIIEFYIRPKKKNIAGLQVADLIVSPVGRFVLGKTTYQDFKIIESKLRTNHLNVYEGFGLVVLPK